PGTPEATLIPYQADAAIATGEGWKKQLLDTEVHEAIEQIEEAFPAATRAEVQPGKGADIRIVLARKRGLDRVAGLHASNHISSALGSTPLITERIDSLELRITTAKG